MCGKHETHSYAIKARFFFPKNGINATVRTRHWAAPELRARGRLEHGWGQRREISRFCFFGCELQVGRTRVRRIHRYETTRKFSWLQAVEKSRNREGISLRSHPAKGGVAPRIAA